MEAVSALYWQLTGAGHGMSLTAALELGTAVHVSAACSDFGEQTLFTCRIVQSRPL